MPRKRNSLKHDLFIAASKNITNNRTRTSYKRAITRFTKWAKEHNIKKKSDITEEVIQLYQLDLNDDPKQYSVATIHTYLAPVCKAVDINMNRVRKDKRSSDKIIRGRVKSKNSQGKHQETDSRFSRLVNFQRAVGIRRSELKKLKGKDIRKDNNGNYYVLVQRGKGGKFQPQLILPQDVPVVLDTFKNKQEDDYIFTDVEMNNLINLHGMRAQHARECYYFYLKKLQDNPNFKVNLKNFLIERWEVGNKNLRDKSLKKFEKQKKNFINELRDEPYKIRGSNYKKALNSALPTNIIV